ncbi:hypothetical protein BN1708_001266 [Verticillium longisporum]|uniref:Uncharacterized protein n=1 Tax=Verticillium longisporum TaxID=100787 RepID=A0A0G4MN96_VERLO|nr:hypothetical protein BN1708_001266 [Verticillium longisporum]
MKHIEPASPTTRRTREQNSDVRRGSRGAGAKEDNSLLKDDTQHLLDIAPLAAASDLGQTLGRVPQVLRREHDVGVLLVACLGDGHVLVEPGAALVQQLPLARQSGGIDSVPLVDDEDRCLGLRGELDRLRVVDNRMAVRGRLNGGQHDDNVRVERLLLGAADALPLHGAYRSPTLEARLTPESSRVGKEAEKSADVETRLDNVPRGARLARHDGRLAANDEVHERALAHVRGSQQGDADTAPQKLARRSGGLVPADALENLDDEPADVPQQLGGGLVKVLVLRKVDQGLELGARCQQRRAPFLVGAAQGARRAPDGGQALLLRVGGQGVAQALDLREIEAVVEESAARELARLSVADDGRGTSAPWNGGEDGLDGGLAAVHMELEDVIACDSPGAGKVEDQGAGIEDVGRWWRAGIVEGAHRGLAGWREGSGRTELAIDLGRAVNCLVI